MNQPSLCSLFASSAFPASARESLSGATIIELRPATVVAKAVGTTARQPDISVALVLLLFYCAVTVTWHLRMQSRSKPAFSATVHYEDGTDSEFPSKCS